MGNFETEQSDLFMDCPFYEKLIENLAKIMRERRLTQATMADYAGIDPSQFSKVLKGSTILSIPQFSNIATHLAMSEIDIITYPEKYRPLTVQESEPIEAVLQIKLKKEKKDQVLKLVFGENNIEILNK